MLKVFQALTGVWGYVAIAALAGGLCVWATYLIDNSATLKCKVNVAVEHANNAQGALVQYQAATANINVAAIGYAKTKIDLDATFATINRDFENETRSNPLPSGCKPDAGRLLSLAAAVAAANKAAAP
jgi:hypothetical protein